MICLVSVSKKQGFLHLRVTDTTLIAVFLRCQRLGVGNRAVSTAAVTANRLLWGTTGGLRRSPGPHGGPKRSEAKSLWCPSVPAELPRFPQPRPTASKATYLSHAAPERTQGSFNTGAPISTTVRTNQIPICKLEPPDVESPPPKKKQYQPVTA